MNKHAEQLDEAIVAIRRYTDTKISKEGVPEKIWHPQQLQVTTSAFHALEAALGMNYAQHGAKKTPSFENNDLQRIAQIVSEAYQNETNALPNKTKKTDIHPDRMELALIKASTVLNILETRERATRMGSFYQETAEKIAAKNSDPSTEKYTHIQPKGRMDILSGAHKNGSWGREQ